MKTKLRRLLALAGAASMAVFVWGYGTSAQETEAAAPSIPKVMIRAPRAITRTVDDALAFEAQNAPALAPLAEDMPRYMPTQDPAQLALAKAQARAVRGPNSKANALAGSEVDAQAPAVLAPPPNVFANFAGANQANSGGAFPPDTHGTVGPAHIVEAVNVRIFVFNKAGGAIANFSLQGLFGTTAFLFDPRVVYDQTWNRYVIVATRRPPSATSNVRQFFVAVSQTGNPVGSYHTYTLPFGGGQFNAGDWCDFPQLGMNQDAVLITCNFFDTATGPFKFAGMMPLAKARIYNGLRVTFPIFPGLRGTLAPPIVYDQNKDAYFVAASNLTHLHLYRGNNLSHAFEATLVLQATIDVPNYAAPPDASQPGTTHVLDTADGRFVNASTQIGDNLWNAHTIALGGFAAPKFYQIDTEAPGANRIKQQDIWFESATSEDFNVSIAANGGNEAVVTWSTTDATSASATVQHQARMRWSGRQPADALNTMPQPGFTLFTSAVALTGNFQTEANRWGDYSAVAPDPSGAGACAPNRRFVIVNEVVNAAAQWGSRIGRIGFC